MENKKNLETIHDNYAGYTEEDLKSLTEWECQDMHGGKMPFCDNAVCKHQQCHPLNDDRVRERLGNILKKGKM